MARVSPATPTAPEPEGEVSAMLGGGASVLAREGLLGPIVRIPYSHWYQEVSSRTHTLTDLEQRGGRIEVGNRTIRLGLFSGTHGR